MPTDARHRHHRRRRCSAGCLCRASVAWATLLVTATDRGRCGRPCCWLHLNRVSGDKHVVITVVIDFVSLALRIFACSMEIMRKIGRIFHHPSHHPPHSTYALTCKALTVFFLFFFTASPTRVCCAINKIKKVMTVSAC